MAHRIRLPELESFEEPVVVLWHGAVRRSERLERPGDWRVETFLGRLFERELSMTQPNLAKIGLAKGPLLTTASKFLLLKPGSVWRRGVLEFEYPLEPAEIAVRSIPVGTGPTEESSIDRLVTLAGLENGVQGPPAIDSKGFVIPPSIGSAMCVFLEDAEIQGKSVPSLIPCWEVFRFFFGGSPNLVHELLNGGLPREDFPGLDGANRIFSPAAALTGWLGLPGSGKFKIRLRKRIPYSDAKIVALIAACRRHRLSASALSLSLASPADRTRRFPQAFIPLRGNFRLIVRGVRIRSGNGDPRFLVMRIEGVTGSPPIVSRVWVSRDNDGRSAAPTGSDLAPAWQHAQRAQKQSDPTDQKSTTLDSEIQSDAGLIPIEHNVEDLSSSYVNAPSIAVQVADKSAQDFLGQKRILTLPGQPSHFSDDLEGSTSAAARGIASVHLRDESQLVRIPSVPEDASPTLRALVSVLHALPSIFVFPRMRCLNSIDPDGIVSHAPFDGPWNRLPGGGFRPIYLADLYLPEEEAWATLVEIEPSVGESFYTALVGTNDLSAAPTGALLYGVLEKCAKLGGRWSKVKASTSSGTWIEAQTHQGHRKNEKAKPFSDFESAEHHARKVRAHLLRMVATSKGS